MPFLKNKITVKYLDSVQIYPFFLPFIHQLLSFYKLFITFYKFPYFIISFTIIDLSLLIKPANKSYVAQDIKQASSCSVYQPFIYLFPPTTADQTKQVLLTSVNICDQLTV